MNSMRLPGGCVRALRILLCTFSLAGANVRHAVSQSTGSSEDEQTVKQIVADLEEAISERKQDVWQKYMADDGVLVDRDGKTNTKQEVLDELTPLPKGRFLSIKPIHTNVYVHDQTALVSFVADEKLTIFGQKMDTKYPSVMYFEKRGGEWQMVFFSYFELPFDPAPVKISKHELKSCTGVYLVSDEMKIEATATDTSLMYKKVGSTGKGTELYPIDTNGRFFRAGTESEFIFDKDAEGHSVLRQRRNWIDLVWRKN